tara:strand:+ start:291 stop:1856 length:1566 start_codon:yes stop_codon:yes gene_type:complete
MKKLKSGAVNSISFIKNLTYTINSFDVLFEKVVGSTALTLTDLQDQLSLASCNDFILLNLDLITHTLSGGEYYMTVSNAGGSSTYLCEIEDYSYASLGSTIYSDSVVLSGADLSSLSVTANTTPVNPSAGNSSSMSVTLRDNEYGNMSSPYYVRTDNWAVIANVENIGTVITKVRHRITNSSNQEISKLFSVVDNSFLYTQFIIENENINFGDVADLVIEGLNSSDEVVYTSSIYKLIIAPKISLYVAESISAANDMRTNGSSSTEILNGDTNVYNLYAYLESNVSASIVLDNISIVNDKVFINGSALRLDGTSPLTITPTVGSMELISSDVSPDWIYEIFERNINYFCRFTWSGGYSTPLVNNITDFYNWFSYGISSNAIHQRPYPKETLTIAGTTFTAEGFSPILYNSLTTYAVAPNDTLSLYMGDGTYQMNINYINSIAVQQEYSDGTTEETIITKAQIGGGQAFPSSLGDAYDIVAYISRINSSKTLVHNKAWIKYGSYWFNIDNDSIDSPHLLLER